MKSYDILIIGPVSLDHNIDYLGNERKEVGGAVVASGFAAAGSGDRVTRAPKRGKQGLARLHRNGRSSAALYDLNA